ncbi:hypothetical protein [Gordonia soli]|nr:hypothetical protein [Gordonia soli]
MRWGTVGFGHTDAHGIQPDEEVGHPLISTTVLVVRHGRGWRTPR